MFGRRRDDEDPFAALRDQAPGATTHVGAPRPDPASLGHPDGGNGGTGGDPERRRPRSRRVSDRFLILLTVLLALGGAGALVWMSERDANERGVGDERAGGGASGRSGSGSERGGAGDSDETRGDGRGSNRADFVQPVWMGDAIERVQSQLKRGERIGLLRVARDRVNAYTVLRDGRQRLISVDDELEVDTTSAGFAGSRRGVPLAAIDPQAPSRAVRGAARKGRFSPRKLDYLVLVAPIISGMETSWSLFFTDVAQRNRQWTAGRSGAPVLRLGERPPSGTTTSSNSTSSLTITRNGRTIKLDGAEAQRISACVRRAGTDAAKIQRCLP
ncbi:hypothetical protein [Conexibacter woesei]|uniref:Uncharacterized protein n=1 Tax=Conexibacter woesei (strain DSM 14684 / CCUG 47730 / CIP 108061 / JCM 11494 / NBRC 100937 / ID131577) TaxID=469383 RepID=D3F2T6_CONWI|nr:hypothetical protein [Conexibacter woesei]ADB54217.1 hypothetical protein Cwoe_5816 [Conexibacter woesei DSM 14684]